MREIKFRVPVFSHATAKFLRFEYWSASHMCFSCDAPNIKSNDDVYGDDEQFTGLRDKNGKEIYKGDILDYGLIKGFVEFVGIGYSLTRGDHGYILKPKDYTECEVIGNIHENPELLK